MPLLNTSQSIVDFLKSKGFKPTAGDKYPLFQERTQIYNFLGLQNKLGEFKGSGDQNIALLKTLSDAEKRAGVSINPSNVFDVLKVYQKETTPPQPIKPAAIQPTIEQPAITKPALTTASFPPPLTQGSPQSQNEISQQPEAIKNLLQKLYQPLDEETIAQQALQKIQSSAEFPLRQAQHLEEKEALKIQEQREKEDFIKNIASRGLIFSGRKTAGISQIEADTLAKMMNIDRKYALLLAQGLQSAAKEIAAQAQKGNELAIKSLEALGYVINPLTGNIEPTLAARKATEQEEQFKIREERLKEQFDVMQALREATFALNTAKTQAQLQQAQQRIDALYLNLAQKGEQKKANEALVAQVLTNPKVYPNLPPATQREIAPMLAQYGFKFPKKLTAEQEKTMLNAQSGIMALDVLQNALDTNPNIFKLISFAPFGIGWTDIRLAQKEAADVITRLRTGAALNQHEMDFYKNYVPQWQDDPQRAQFKINFLKNFYKLFADNPETTFPEIKKAMAKTLKSGEILVINKQTGEMGALPAKEYNPKLYFKLTY